MNRGFPSMTALLGLLAVAGYQNRDKIAEMLGGIGKGRGGRRTKRQRAGGRRARRQWWLPRPARQQSRRCLCREHFERRSQ